ncbi:MAG: hypothetical protein PHE93_04490 [Clostridia bacterium]|nr:hypothetical protein [Clostridia bacterium]
MIGQKPKKYFLGVFFFVFALIFEFSNLSLYSYSTAHHFSSIAYAIDAPSNLTAEFTDEKCFAKWSGVDGASYYNIRLNTVLVCENQFFPYAECSFEITNYVLSPDYYLLEVCTADDNGDLSEYASFNFTVHGTLSTPQNLSVNGNMLLWESVDYAGSYQIKINSILAGTVFDTSFDLSGILALSSAYTITVTAIPETSDLLRSNSIPQSLIHSFSEQLASPQNASIACFNGEYFLSWSGSAQANRYYYCDKSAYSNELSLSELESIMSCTSDCYARVTDLFSENATTIILVAASADNRLSQIVEINLLNI